MNQAPLQVGFPCVAGSAMARTVGPSRWPGNAARRPLDSGHGRSLGGASRRRSSPGDQARRHGAVLFRGFPSSRLRTSIGSSRLSLENYPYEELSLNAVRQSDASRVGANEAPPTIEIYLTHEMRNPQVLSELPLLLLRASRRSRGSDLALSVRPALEPAGRTLPRLHLRLSGERGLRTPTLCLSPNTSNSGMGRSWQNTLRATTRKEAEDRLKALQYRLGVGSKTTASRVTTPVLPAVHNVAQSFLLQPTDRRLLWTEADRRNDPAKSIRFGDGTPLDAFGVSHGH